ncbi:hypothetical protein AJ79_07479 [Helicocarpus griseus UAMH5409]|uniref:Uncharacterized protein n=1 Tax=Helicocarpus griseus UAMH5409 TaxID=1447875 RepID=A0A2B7X1X2_9EURO|nr:hypothetical protein AJ79_07479 [Helicocarpus griseus UAMH5409]
MALAIPFIVQGSNDAANKRSFILAATLARFSCKLTTSLQQHYVTVMPVIGIDGTNEYVHVRSKSPQQLPGLKAGSQSCDDMGLAMEEELAVAKGVSIVWPMDSLSYGKATSDALASDRTARRETKPKFIFSQIGVIIIIHASNFGVTKAASG